MFYKHIHNRIQIVLVIVAILFLVIIAKVFYTQVFDYKKLNGYAANLWSRNLPIEGKRGYQMPIYILLLVIFWAVYI